jgi:hypothetical protein
MQHNIPENNCLREEIQQIVGLCAKLEETYGENSSWFDLPEAETDISDWEKRNNITIPTIYKEWLRFSGESQILNTLAHFLGTKSMGSEPYCMGTSAEFMVIGELIGDGEKICFKKSNGEFFRYNHDKIIRIDFKDFLNNTIIRMLKKAD